MDTKKILELVGGIVIILLAFLTVLMLLVTVVRAANPAPVYIATYTCPTDVN